MIIKHLSLKNFRSHEDTVLSFRPGFNVISGPNGTGKTNTLEAVHYLCLTKSFLTSSDRYVLRHDAAFFEIVGEFESASGRALSVRIAFVPGEGKKLFVNGVHVLRASEFIGRIPVVVFSPDDYVITAGGPEERRRFVNTIVSQSSSVYLNDLMRYRRTLKQRNELLQYGRRRAATVDTEQITSWSRELVETGSRIFKTRFAFVETFNSLLAEAYTQIGSVIEEPKIFYRPLDGVKDFTDSDEIRNAFRTSLEKNRTREQERGITLTGPHRDDFHFELAGKPVRRYASQGQHRSFGLALKLAQYNYLLEQMDETPLLLLDDVFDNLDSERIAVFCSILQADDMGQSLITAARKEIFGNLLPERSERHIDIRDTIST